MGGDTRGAPADSSGQLPGRHTTLTHTQWDFKSYRFSSLMVFNRIMGALFPCSLVSLKDEWNEGSPRLRVVIKHLEVESKRQKRNNYKYNQAVVSGWSLICLKSLLQISLQLFRTWLFQVAICLSSSSLQDPISCKCWSFSCWKRKNNSQRPAVVAVPCDKRTWCHWVICLIWLKWEILLCIFYPVKNI